MAPPSPPANRSSINSSGGSSSDPHDQLTAKVRRYISYSPESSLVLLVMLCIYPPLSSTSSPASVEKTPAISPNTIAIFSIGAVKFVSPSTCRILIPIFNVLSILLSCIRYHLTVPHHPPHPQLLHYSSSYPVRHPKRFVSENTARTVERGEVPT